MSEDGKHIAFWVVSMDAEASDIWSNLGDTMTEFGVTNSDDVWSGRYRAWNAQGILRPYLEDIRYDRFEPAPRYVSLTSFQPDYVADRFRIVSPKLFEALDQPKGSIQGWPVDTVWLGDDPPGWSYLWLCYIPSIPAVDLERSDVAVEEWDKDGVKVPQITSKGALVLRADLQAPCGLFKAAEGGSIMLATDAVAEAVVRAGCVGIEFLDPETAFANGGPVLRRGLHGPEPRPSLEAEAVPNVPPAWCANLPLVGPPLVWDTSPVDWLDWAPADAALEEPVASLESGEAGDALARFLQNSIYFDDEVATEVLEAIADVHGGRSDLWVSDLPVWDLVLRPDAAWLRHENAVAGYGPFAYPLDGMAAVVKRWMESIKRAPDPFG